MPIHKTCELCNKAYTVPPARAASRFCSLSCHNVAQRTAERRTLSCTKCGAEFVAKQDHGVWPKFCSRDCFLVNGGKGLDPIECGCCGGMFTPDQRDRLYCSPKCASEGRRTAQERKCVNCGAAFLLHPSTIKKKRRDESCCSLECRTQYYTAERASRWNGGRYLSDSAGHAFTRLIRPDYVGKYIQEHRLAASRALGRAVERGEVVICINRDKSDLRPSNLYLCGSMSEYARIRDGVLPWPTQSNIQPETVGAKNTLPSENNAVNP